MWFLKFITYLIAVCYLYGCSAKPLIIDEKNKLPVIKTQTSPSPTVLIAHGCDGWSNNSYYEWLYYFQNLGYNAILVDSFEFRGEKNVCTRGMIIPPSTRSDDFETVAKWAKNQSWHKGGVAVIGFSHGGSTALNIANNKNIKNINAVISYYPSCNLNFVGSSIHNPKIPAQVHLAGKDDWTPSSECGLMEKYDVYHYLNATHAFDVRGKKRKNKYGYLLEYDEEATNFSKKRIEEFLKRTVYLKE